MAKASNWITVAESRFPWEQDALAFVRQQFPDNERYRAWSNFEFIADDGSINEVDLLLFTPEGFFLVEIKSRPGRLFGDAGTWTWENNGKLTSVDNPLFLANSKAKKLRGLLQRQKVCQRKGQLPFLEALVFCSDPALKCELQGNARLRICLRDRPADGATPARPGIMAAVMRRECPGLEGSPKGTHNSPMAKQIAQAMEQLGIRPSQRQRKVSDYVLERVVGEGPGYQDWRAEHVQIKDSKRRIRLYLAEDGTSAQHRQTLQRAALREFQLLESLQHPGVLRVHLPVEHELGPALIFEDDPLAIRLDHYLLQMQDKLSTDTRLDMLRQIAEVIRYAHDKRIVHRALCPQSILVTGIRSDRPRVKVFNWQVGYREGSSSSGFSREVSGTSHVDRLVEDAAAAYMAPEAFTDESAGEHLDVFSLGAIAYYLFSGVPPATNGLELSNKLRDTKGLQISGVLNGASESLQYLIQYSTHPEVTLRLDSVDEFLKDLDQVENELTSPEPDYVDDPTCAKTGDLLPGGYEVIRRLGQGATSVALLARRDGTPFVLKIASSTDHNARIREEAEVLGKLRHQHIVQLEATAEFGDRAGFALRPIFADSTDNHTIQTLGQRRRKEGRLQIDLLQRFGEDLLDVVTHLEEQGIPHRDIKPDNIAVGMIGRGHVLHVVLFDFSLSRMPADNIRAGTVGYLDPLLPLRKPPRWDLHAERYSAAATLYELATGELPKWGDGQTDPSHLGPDTEVTIDPEAFDPGPREHLVEFFRKAFRRDISQRFHNAEEMREAWRESFKQIDDAGPDSDHRSEAELQERLAEATFDTQIPELGLGTRAANVLDRYNVLTVEDLLSFPMFRLVRLRGVGSKTRREMMAAVKILRERLGKPDREPAAEPEGTEVLPESLDVGSLSVDLLSHRLQSVKSRDGDTVRSTLHALLGLDSRVTDPWPGQANLAGVLGVTRARIGQVLAKLQVRWAKDPALTRLRSDLVGILDAQGGVMTLPELVEALLVARGSSEEEPQRSALAQGVIRAAVEVERTDGEPRMQVRRDANRILIACTPELGTYARRLGEAADRIAASDPLLPSARVLELLREVPAPTEVSLPDTRLLRLAAGVSESAAVSSRQELYPRNMPATRALRLSQGALLGVSKLTADQIRERVASRYPDAEPLPDPPALDRLLSEAGLNLEWNAATSAFVSAVPAADRSITSGSASFYDKPTSQPTFEPGEITSDIADRRAFDERLQRALYDGAFLTLTVPRGGYQAAIDKLTRKYPVQLVDFEGLFLDALQQVAASAKVNFDIVLKTDSAPNSGDWDKLKMLVGRAMPAIEQQLLQADQTMLVVYAGLLGRYDQMPLLSRLAERVGRRDGIPGLWLLVAGELALLDGKPIPLIGPGQKVRIPDAWLANGTPLPEPTASATA